MPSISEQIQKSSSRLDLFIDEYCQVLASEPESLETVDAQEAWEKKVAEIHRLATEEIQNLADLQNELKSNSLQNRCCYFPRKLWGPAAVTFTGIAGTLVGAYLQNNDIHPVMDHIGLAIVGVSSFVTGAGTLWGAKVAMFANTSTELLNIHQSSLEKSEHFSKFLQEFKEITETRSSVSIDDPHREHFDHLKEQNKQMNAKITECLRHFETMGHHRQAELDQRLERDLSEVLKEKKNEQNQSQAEGRSQAEAEIEIVDENLQYLEQIHRDKAKAKQDQLVMQHKRSLNRIATKIVLSLPAHDETRKDYERNARNSRIGPDPVAVALLNAQVLKRWNAQVDLNVLLEKEDFDRNFYAEEMV